ncbi:hypothetical protein F4680DRAFT_469145 [Xylaria scruposa]|nr:hypothetical protein F4680DRAFT_469145 [Xylaria scruposa]
MRTSALHLARRESNRCCQLEERAEMHLTIGRRRVTEILPNLSAENCAELYVATILVCICNFAKRPGPGHLLLVADGSEVAWWELFRGVRIIVESIGLSTVFSGELGPLPSDTEGDQQDENPRHHRRVSLNVIEWEAPLGCLSSLFPLP